MMVPSSARRLDNLVKRGPGPRFAKKSSYESTDFPSHCQTPMLDSSYE